MNLTESKKTKHTEKLSTKIWGECHQVEKYGQAAVVILAINAYREALTGDNLLRNAEFKKLQRGSEKEIINILTLPMYNKNFPLVSSTIVTTEKL